MDVFLGTEGTFKEVRERNKHLFTPQLDPAAGGCRTDDVQSDDEPTLCRYHEEKKTVCSRVALGVYLPWMFRQFGVAATRPQILNFF